MTGTTPRPTLCVESPAEVGTDKYIDIATEVFRHVSLEHLKRQNIDKFDADTRLYAFEQDGRYVSVIFVHPFQIGPLRVGGIGGVATRDSHRGQGLAKALVERAIADTAQQYVSLMLWTRIPDFFASVGFKDVSDMFEDDPGGSTPMMYFHRAGSEVRKTAAGKLSRLYF